MIATGEAVGARLILQPALALGPPQRHRPPSTQKNYTRTGPRICRNARRRRAVVVFWDESGVSLLPVVRHTWAPVGHTPVIRHRFNWQRASMAAALCYGSHGGGAALAFHHQVDAYNSDTLIGALAQLRRFLDGQKATLVWDGLPAHRSLAMRTWLRRQRSWLVVEPLPGYAPELNPVEGCGPASKAWSWPTSPATPSTTSSLRPSAASSGSATPPTWPTHSCVTAACPCGDHVTGRSEAL